MDRVFARMRTVGVGLVTLIIASAALADVKPVPARLAVVAKDGAAMRCGDAGHLYSVTTLKAGQLLRIDGEGGGWVRCDYPEGTKAYVKADEAEFDEASKTVKLTKPSALMAVNANGTAPWWYLLDKQLAAGTAFAPAEAVKTADGAVSGYLVPAPAQARGFVRAELVRAPTTEEAAKYTGPAIAMETTPGKPAGGDAELVEVKPQGVAPLADVTVVRPAPANPVLTKRIDDLNLLRDIFDRVMARAEDDSEIRTAMSEFDRKITALPTTGEDGRIRTGLEQRRDALRLRGQIIETRRKIQDTGTIDEKMRQIHLAVQEAEKQAIYTIVGRIMPSTVYDGKRGMMLMYRVESADYSSTRTVGYVVPRDGLDLLPKMGKVVGIVGDSRMDPALGLNIVAPQRVDELQVVAGKFEVVPGSTATPSPGLSKPTEAPAPAKEAAPVATPESGDMNK